MKGKWILVGVFVLVLVTGAAAGLATADSEGHFSLMARTMQPADSSIRYDSYDDGYLRTVQESSLNAETVYAGQVDLPDGATVVSVRAFGLDSDPVGEFCFGLVRCNLDEDPVCSAVTQVICSGEFAQPGKTELLAPLQVNMGLVDNVNYSYNIFAQLPTPYNPPNQDLGMLRFRVDTSYSAHVPIVQRNWSGQ